MVPDFSQNLNAIFTYMRARRWEGRKKEKNVVITHRSGWEAVPSQMEHRQGCCGGKLITYIGSLSDYSTHGIGWEDDQEYANMPSLPSSTKGS